MKMKRGSILVILALQLALLLAGAGARSQLADDLPAIRLPSDAKGVGNHAAGEGNNDKPKPWGDCCDFGICKAISPPSCTCFDKVESCASACKDCQEVHFSAPPRYVCRDWYNYDIGESTVTPRCT